MTPSMGRSEGLFLTFEGIEGSGKSSQIARIRRRLDTAGLEVVATREPGGTDVGARLRALLLATCRSPITPVAELLLYAADRAQHLAEIVDPAVGRGAIVLCDRYLDATMAYQGYGRRLGAEAVLSLHRLPPLDRRPRRTILLDLAPEEGVARARRRNRDLGLERTEGRFEKEDLEFHRRVREGYLVLAAAEPERFRVVGAGGDEDEVEARVAAALADLLPCLARDRP